MATGHTPTSDDILMFDLPRVRVHLTNYCLQSVTKAIANVPAQARQAQYGSVMAYMEEVAHLITPVSLWLTARTMPECTYAR